MNKLFVFVMNTIVSALFEIQLKKPASSRAQAWKVLAPMMKEADKSARAREAKNLEGAKDGAAPLCWPEADACSTMMNEIAKAGGMPIWYLPTDADGYHLFELDFGKYPKKVGLVYNRATDVGVLEKLPSLKAHDVDAFEEKLARADVEEAERATKAKEEADKKAAAAAAKAAEADDRAEQRKETAKRKEEKPAKAAKAKVSKAAPAKKEEAKPEPKNPAPAKSMKELVAKVKGEDKPKPKAEPKAKRTPVEFVDGKKVKAAEKPAARR